MSKTYEEKLRQKLLKEEQVRFSSNQQRAINLADQFLNLITKDIAWQREFVLDTNTHKAIFGERRGGKTNVMAIAAIYKALQTPNIQILYIGLTQTSCQRIMSDQVLARILRSYPLPAKLVGQDLRFDNGSIIYLIGIDANKKQKEKIRGIKSSLNMIDEMQSYTQDTQLILNEVLGPTTADTKASTILAGTAGDAIGKSYWYEITKDNTPANPISKSVLHPEWMVYRSSWKDNTAIDEITNQRICDNVQEYLNDLIQEHPGIQLTDSFRQEWGAEWIVLSSSLVYPRFSDANLISSPTCRELDTKQAIPMPPTHILQSMTHILGIDLGFNDQTTMCVLGYHTKFSNKVYVLESFGKSEMLIPEVVAKIRELDNHYHFSYMVGDSSSLQIFETLKEVHGFPIHKADRAGKYSHQRTLNSDLQTRTIIFLPGNEELIQQLKTIQWDKKKLQEGKYQEDPSFNNDLADSFLYAHHFSRHLWYEAPRIIPSPGEYFTRAILTGELQASRSDFISQDRQRFNPYARRKQY